MSDTARGECAPHYSSNNRAPSSLESSRMPSPSRAVASRLALLLALTLTVNLALEQSASTVPGTVPGTGTATGRRDSS